MNPYEDLLGTGQLDKQKPSYDSLVDADRTARNTQLRTNVLGARQFNPDDIAKALKLERTTRIPAEVAARNLPEIEQTQALDSYEDLIRRSPRLAEAVGTDRMFAAVAYDDMRNLEEIERTLQNNALRPPSQPPRTAMNILRGLGTSFVEGAEAARQGIRRQFADLIGSTGMQSDAERRTAAAQGRIADTTPDFKGNWLDEGIYGGFRSLLQAIPSIGAGVATGNPVLGLGLLGAQTQATAYGKYRNRGATGGEAFLGATGEGAVEVATEMLPMSFLVRSMGKVNAGQFLTGLLARELPTEQIATLVQDALDTAIANPDKTWQQYLDERPEAAFKTLVGTLVMSGTMGTIHRVMRDMDASARAAERAQVSEKLVTDLSALRAASKLAERDPVTFAKFVDTAAEGGAITDVFVNANTLAESLKQLGAEGVTALEAQIPGFTQLLTEAAVVNGDVRLSVGEFAAHFAGTPLEAALVRELRTEPGGMSIREAEEFMQTQSSELERATAEAMQQASVTDAFTASKEAVQQSVLGQLTAAGRFNANTNQAYATLMGNFYATMAARTGVTPEEFAAKYPIRIVASAKHSDTQGTLIEGQDPRALGFTQVKASEELRAWFAGSKVADSRGQPTVVYHGTDAGPFGAFAPGTFFTSSPREAGAYARAGNVVGRERAKEKYSVATGAGAWAGKRVPYAGVLSDHGAVPRGAVVASDAGVFRSVGGGRWEVFTDVFPDFNSADARAGDIALVRRDNTAGARALVDDYAAFVDEAMPGGDGGRVIPVYLKLLNPIRLDPFQANRLGIRLGATREEVTAFIARLEAQGYDGIVTESDEVTMFPELEDRPVEQYIIFRPEQVRSAITGDALEQSPASDIGHKRESTSGRYVGAPVRVGNSPQKLAALRREIRQLAQEGEPGRHWYENSSRAILDFVGGDRIEAEKIAALIAIYSPNATVPANTSMALTAYYQFRAGVPIKAGFGTSNTKAQQLLSGGERWSGIKTNSFYQNLMVNIDPTKLEPGVATMDMWMALAFDYGDKKVDQGPKYKFMERETQRLARELGWSAHQVQAAIWTAMKGRIDPIRPQLRERELKLGIRAEFEKDGKTFDAVVKGKESEHFYLARKMGMAQEYDRDAIEAAKYDFSDAIAERAVQISWEATPGESTGVLPGIHAATAAQKMEYLRRITEVLNPAGKDLIAEAVGLPPGHNVFGWSAWEGIVGAGAQTLVAAPLEGAGGKRTFKPEAAERLRLYAAMRGYVLSQESVIWHLPVFDGAKKSENGVEVKATRAFSPEEMRELYDALHEQFGTWEIAPAYTRDGARILNFVDGLSNEAFRKGLDEVLLKLPETFGGGALTARMYRSEGGYVSNDWGKNPDGEGYLVDGLSGRRDLQERAADLRARVEAVNREFAQRYGWDQPGDADARGPLGDPRLAEAQRTATQAAFGAQKLIGLPDAPMRIGEDFYVPGPFAPAHDLAREYMRRAGMQYEPPRTYAKVDRDRAAHIAAAYEAMPHDPHNPEVKAAYAALVKETAEQYRIVLESGLQVEFIDPAQGDPYAASPRLAIKDVTENNHMWVFSTRDGFGSNAQFDPAENPLLAETEFTISGKTALVNDLFRVVHDYFGHVKDGVGFRADGEENAWRSHRAMFSPLARRALTSETRGQNSWVNFGPHGDKNRTASAADTVFADQKTGLLPEWVVNEGAGDDLLQTTAQLSRPPVESDGTVVLTHYSRTAGLSTLSPAKHGTGIAGAESKRKQADPDNWVDRTYYGIGVGRPGGYVKESGLGNEVYEARVPAAKLYDMAADPDGLRERPASGWTNAVSLYERKIRDAGYAGFWVNHPSLGLTAALFSEQAVTKAEVAQSKATNVARGALTVGLDVPVMKLYDAADLSTFLHEAGHFFLEVMAKVANEPNAPQQVRDDMATFLAWANVPDLATWNSWTLGQKRDAHEWFARTFEAYLMQGKSPSVEMQTLFGRFRAWLLNVYRGLKLKARLDPEISGVFDRMLASDEAIREAQVEKTLNLSFKSAEDARMTADEWRAYQELGELATEESVAKLQSQALRNMQWLGNARDQRIRNMQRKVARIRKDVHKEVQAEVRRDKLYAAIHFLRTGELELGDATNAQRKLLDSVAGYKPKLDRTALKEIYGEGPAAPWRYIPTNLTSNEDGVHPDIVAKLFGFSSGDQLVVAMLAAEPESQVVEAKTDQAMLERHGDLTVPGALEKAVDRSLANDVRLRVLEVEFNALARATGRPKILGQAAKRFADQLVSRRRIRELRPSSFENAAVRSGRSVDKAMKAGNIAEAATEKRNQLVNMYAARSAHEAEAEIEKGLRYLKRFDNAKIRKRVDPDYVDQIDALMEQYDLRATSGVADRKRATLAKWIEAQRAKGFEPEIDESLLDDARRRPYQTLTVEEWRGLIDAVRNIEHLGRLKSRLLTASDRADFQRRVEEAEAAIRGNARKPASTQLERNRWRDRVSRGFREVFAIHRKFSSLAREMDGFKDGGVLWELLVRPMNRAGDAEASARAKAADALAVIFKNMTGLKTKRFIPAINDSLSREGRLAIALNWGNETNRQRVMEGDRWTAPQVEAILQTLTREDWDFVQATWTYLDSFWPQIAAKERRVNGIEPARVEPLPFTRRLPDGSEMILSGGYYPIKVDTDRSGRAEAYSAAELVKQAMQGKMTRATTRRGHTKARAESGLGPVSKSLGVVFEHVDQVIHDLSWHEWLIDANRLLAAGGRIDTAVREHYGPAIARTMRDMLEDIAIGEIGGRNVFERSINHVRTGATIAGLGWNLVTALLQPFGLTQSMVRIGPKWVAKGMWQWMGDATKMENTATWIRERSEFMATRGKTMQREINEIRNRVEKGRISAVTDSYFWMIQKMQQVADIPTWLGAYEKAMADPANDEARAIALADQAVLDSQGGGQIKDLAQIQRGGPLMKLWTNFYSFFNTTYNLMAESVGRTRFNKPGTVARLAADSLLLLIVPAVLSTIMKEAIKGGDDDEDKLYEKIAREQLNYILGTMVGLRDMASFVNGIGGYSGPAGLRFFSEMFKLGKQAEQGEVDAALLKSMNNVAGILFHYPAGQVQRTVQGINAWVEGETENPLAPLVGVPTKR